MAVVFLATVQRNIVVGGLESDVRRMREESLVLPLLLIHPNLNKDEDQYGFQCNTDHLSRLQDYINAIHFDWRKLEYNSLKSRLLSNCSLKLSCSLNLI